MNSKLPIVFFGSSHLVIPIIENLKNNFDLQLVITTEKNSTNPVPSYCTQHNIPLRTVQTLSDDTIYHLLSTIYTPVGVVASFGLIIPQEVINIFPKGIVNIHPSFLPQYRGATPIQTALLNGDTETAVSIMVIDEEIDHGPLLAQIPLEITPSDTSESLYSKAFTLGAEKLIDILPAYVEGNIEPREQDHSKATFTPRSLTKKDGLVDFDETNNMSALEIENCDPLEKVVPLWQKLKIARMIRAYYPWPGVWTTVKINGQEKILKLLPQQMFQVEGKNPVSKKDLLNGYPELKEVIEKLG